MSTMNSVSLPGCRAGGHSPQSGFSLIVVLLMVVIITVLGVGAAQFSLVNERSARNDRDSEVAFQAAEAALLDAELDVLGPNPASTQRLCSFSNTDVSAFVPGCGNTAANRGLCAPSPEGMTPAWLAVDFSIVSDTAKSVRFGEFTGQAYLSGSGMAPARTPRYVIEAMRNNGGWQANQLQSASARSATNIFRVTAIGYGVRDDTQVVLQTTLSKTQASPGCPS